MRRITILAGLGLVGASYYAPARQEPIRELTVYPDAAIHEWCKQNPGETKPNFFEWAEAHGYKRMPWNQWVQEDRQKVKNAFTSV